MKTIAHISDLHFPYTSDAVRSALAKSLWHAKPDLLVISGDLTQRAREAQYAAAQAFIESLPRPQIIIPGNHDVPLYDLVRRFFKPTERFVRYICDDLMPTFHADDLFVVGANSTRAFTLDPYGFWKNGSLSDEQLQRIGEHFARADAASLRILVMHHPLVNPWNAGSRDTARGRERIITSLENAGVQIVLSGHLHLAYNTHAPSHAAAKVTTAGRILCIQAGTACSTRLRGGETNSFNLLNWRPGELVLTVMRYSQGKFIADTAATLPLT